MSNTSDLNKYVVRLVVPIEFAMVVEATSHSAAIDHAEDYVMNTDAETIAARYLCDLDYGAIQSYSEEVA